MSGLAVPFYIVYLVVFHSLSKLYKSCQFIFPHFKVYLISQKLMCYFSQPRYKDTKKQIDSAQQN